MPSNMSLSTNWNTTFWNGVFQQSFLENNKLRDEMFNYVYQKGTNGFRYKTTVTTEAANTVSALSGPGSSQTGLSVTVDNPLVAHEFIGYDQMNVNQTGTELNTAFAAALASRLANTRQAQMLAFFAKTTYDAGASNRASFNDEATTTEDMGKTVYGALNSIASTFCQNGIPEGDRYVALHPTQFYALRTYAPAASRDYISPSPVNQDSLLGGIQILGFTVVPIYGPFNQDLTGKSTWASKYQLNLAGTAPAKIFGLAWHKNSLAVFESEKPTLKIDDSPENQAMLFTARTQFGTGIVQQSGAVAIHGDT